MAVKSNFLSVYRHLYETMTQGVVLQDGDGKVLEANPAACEILGLPRDNFLGRTMDDPAWKVIREDGSPYDPKEMPSNIALHTGKPVSHAVCGMYTTKADKPVWIEVGASPWIRDDDTKPSCTMTVFTDITQRKRQEAEREVETRIQSIVNARTDLPGLMTEVMHFMQELSGCGAVGIRLRDGDDFPYYKTTGFNQEFVRAETHLCIPNLEGQIQRDGHGNPVLECMCGNVLCGRFDPSKPFFTAQGSFFTNCTTSLLATTSEADRQGRTRNRCNGEGYESVCLVPLRLQGETCGLLQFNDRRKGRFSPEFLHQAERLAVNLGTALAQRTAEATVKEKQSLLQSMFATTPGFLVLKDRNSVYRSVNPAFCQFLGKTEDQIVGRSDYDLFPAEEAELYREGDAKVMATGQTEKGDWEVNGAAGRQWIHVIKTPLITESGDCTGVLCSVTDLSERKRAELKIIEHQKQLKSLTSQLVLAEECERSRLAVHLHDDVCQNLAYTKMRLQMVSGALEDQAQMEDITEVCNTLTQLMQDVRTLTFELSSPLLIEFGLEAAISEWLAAKARII